jgi:hypothetical protein
MTSFIQQLKACFKTKRPNPIQTYQNDLFTNIVVADSPSVIPDNVDKTLYVVLPFFNYCFFHRRKELFQQFIKHISVKPNIKIVVVEAIEHGEKGQLKPEDVSKCMLHISVDTEHRIWLKENLINIGIQHLPKHWKYVAWIDADLGFLNTSWVQDTILSLNEFDVVQLFHTCANLGPEGEVMKVDKSFGYMYLKSGKPYTKTYKYGFWHPGFAWACTRKAYNTMNGLIDWGILGSGDHHMALALIGKVNCSHPGNIHTSYAKQLDAFEKRVMGASLKIGYVPGTIVHYWHGRLEDRKYKERWEILTGHQYDPEKDIYKTSGGVIQLTLSGLRLKNDIHDYFIGRREDNMKL